MSTIITENPFVGLRPFESDESLLFFGRQEQTIELLQRLHQHHFVGIVGSSGCGKSSLIRAGLIPRLKAGYLVNERDKWLIPVFKPGEAPLYNLANAILSELQKDTAVAVVNDYVEKIKEEGSDAIIELLQPTLAENRTNVFLLVDQFEELFRFSMESKDAAKKDEAIDFVNILLQLVNNSELPLYVVITMRSDFIGDCTQFFGLPEALNQSQYLVPRLTREQLKNAIEGPVRLYGGKISPALTTRLLNDVQSVMDELPLLQHALMRTWDHEIKTDRNGELDVKDYEAIGSISKALSMHADEALSAMSSDEQHIAELMFQALTTTDHGGRKVRRPAHISELVSLTASPVAAIRNIIARFNDDKRSFLVESKSKNPQNPLIDISHESLIRQWETLIKWVDEESESAKSYLRLSEAAVLNKEGKKDLITGTELQVLLDWWAKRKPNATWADRYNTIFDESILFLQESKKKYVRDRKDTELKQKKDLRRARITVLIISGIALLAIITSIVAYNAKLNAAASLNLFREAEAGKVKDSCNRILTIADSLKSEYPKVYLNMMKEVDTIIDRKAYKDNEIVQSLSDSFDVILVTGIIENSKKYLNGEDSAFYKDMLREAQSMLSESSHAASSLNAYKDTIDNLLKKQR